MIRQSSIPIIALGSIVRIRTGKLDANASSTFGQYPFFTCASIPLKIDTFTYDCECVLVAGNGDLNVKYYNGKFDAYQRTYIIESKGNNILFPRFLFYFMDKHVSVLRQQAIGGVIKYIKLENLTEAKIPLPPLETQRKIVAVLDKAQELIDLRKAQIEKLDEFLRSVFLDMFGDPVLLVKKWPVTILEKISDIQGGLTLSNKRQDYEMTIPYLRVANVYRERLNLSEIKVVGLTSNEFKRLKLEKGDVLIVEGHGNSSEIGRSAIWDGSIIDCVHQNHLIRVRLNQTVMSPMFLSFIINSTYGKAYFQSESHTTSGLNTISTGKVKLFKCPLPPVLLQTRFASFAESIEKQKTLMQQGLTEMENNFNSLMQRAFRGELF